MEQKSIVFIVVALVVGAALGAGIGMMLSGDESNGEETYWYYLYFADGDERNDWYKGTGSDATKAFDKAMDDAGFDWEKSTWGYISSIDEVNNGSGWAITQYLYTEFTSAAASSSISYDNGWYSTSGFDDGTDDMKLKQFEAKVYFMTPYLENYEDTPKVADVFSAWSTSGPFKA